MLRKIAVPSIIMIVSVFSFYLAFYTIEAVNPLKTGGPAGVWRYWGSSILEVAGNILRNPTDALIVLATPIDKPYFLIFLFGSAFFLPLFAPLELLMSVPWLLAAFLSDYQPYYQPYFQYSAFVLGQLFIAAVFGFRKLFHSEDDAGNKSIVRKRIIMAMLIVNVFLFLAISPAGIPAFTNRGIRPYAINPSSDPSHIAELYKVLSFIPPDASVAAIHNLFPHVSQRLNAYILKWPLDYEVDYIIVDVKSPTYTWSVYGPTPAEIVPNLMNSGEYGILASADGAMLFKKGYNGPLQYFSPQKDTFDYYDLNLGSGRILWDYSTSSTRIISSDPEYSRGFIWFGPYKYLAPGNYSVTFRLKTANETCQLSLDVATKEGKAEIAQRSLSGTEFKKLNEWQDFSIYFQIDVPKRLEFRGYCSSNDTQVELDYIRVEQYSLP
jgi:hypothetical protein